MKRANGGAGRPKKGENEKKIMFSVRIHPSILKALRADSKRRKLSVSEIAEANLCFPYYPDAYTGKAK